MGSDLAGLTSFDSALLDRILAYGAEYLFHKEAHIDSFGHLLPSTELFMFGLPLVAVFIGLLAMIARERAGIVRTQPLTDR
jgi:hypothetical protein